LETVLAAGSRVEDSVQKAVGVDAEYSAGRFLGRSEVIWSQWSVPMPSAATHARLSATSLLAEGRYRILPGVHVAARAERLGFSRLQTTAGLQSWEAPVRRYEIGAGYSVTRNVLVKGSWQRNLRQGGRVVLDTIGALQVVYWF
jgi:hypothetical protein